MHNLIEKYLIKRGVKGTDELDNKPNEDGSPTELQVFEEWTKILSKEEVTLDDVIKFCSSQISFIESKWSDLSVTSVKKAELIPYHTVYKMLLGSISSPDQSNREQLEKRLIEMTK